jgi:hypothetical protein
MNHDFRIKLNFPDNLQELGIIGTPPAYLNETQIPITGDGIMFSELRTANNHCPLFSVQARWFAVRDGNHERVELVLVFVRPDEFPNGG